MEGVQRVAPSGQTAAKSSSVGRAVWTVAVLLFLALAVGAPVQMVRTQRAVHDAKQKATAGRRESPAPGEAAAAKAGPARVRMVSLTFEPGTLTVGKGTEVVFENDDVAPHTVTGTAGGGIDSGILAPRKVYKLVVNEAFEYVCQIHPSMKGKVLLSG